MGRLRLYSDSAHVVQMASPGRWSKRTMLRAWKLRLQQRQASQSLIAGGVFWVMTGIRSAGAGDCRALRGPAVHVVKTAGSRRAARSLHL